jgi:hypothetical protein
MGSYCPPKNIQNSWSLKCWDKIAKMTIEKAIWGLNDVWLKSLDMALEISFEGLQDNVFAC